MPRELLAAALAALAAAACQSSAPYTLPAAAINTAIAAGAATAQRASGGCYAVCTNGNVCNPRTGFCEPASSAAFRVRPPGEVCVDAPGGGKRCTQIVITSEQKPASAAPAMPVGVSPATGSVPPPPSEASPRGP